MNILHMKYAVEVARAGSLSKAAAALFIAQPNLSRAVRDLEADLGITIFERSPKGMSLTAEGRNFIGYAEKILCQIDEVEQIYKTGSTLKKRFSISVPRASYISDAFARFSLSIGDEPTELFYKETDSSRAIESILTEDYNLGIIRFAVTYDKYFRQSLEEKGLTYDLINEFSYVLVASRKSPLASLGEVSFTDLRSHIEIAHADPYVPSLPLSGVRKEELPDDVSRRIFVFERASQFELLTSNPETFMWVSPLPRVLLDRLDLCQIRCEENTRLYRDVLIHKKEYALSELDRRFLGEVERSLREYM